MAKLRVVNVSRNQIVADRAEIADTAPKRNRGLLKHSKLDPGEGLWIVPTQGVHTFAMNFAIDVVYLNKRRQVLKLRPNMVKSRMSLCLSAHSVVELPVGTIAATGTQTGDQFALERYES